MEGESAMWIIWATATTMNKWQEDWSVAGR